MFKIQAYANTFIPAINKITLSNPSQMEISSNKLQLTGNFQNAGDLATNALTCTTLAGASGSLTGVLFTGSLETDTIYSPVLRVTSVAEVNGVLNLTKLPSTSTFPSIKFGSIRTFSSGLDLKFSYINETLFELNQSYLLSNKQHRIIQGAVGTPGLSFNGANTTGLFHQVIDSTPALCISANGVETATFGTSRVQIRKPINAITGGATTPSYSFDNQRTTGMYAYDHNSNVNYPCLSFTAGGTSRVPLAPQSLGTNFSLAYFGFGGTASLGGYITTLAVNSFENDRIPICISRANLGTGSAVCIQFIDPAGGFEVGTIRCTVLLGPPNLPAR